MKPIKLIVLTLLIAVLMAVAVGAILFTIQKGNIWPVIVFALLVVAYIEAQSIVKD